VTGGTRGIGKEVARGLVRRGMLVVIGARDGAVGRKAELELSREGLVHYLPFDALDEGSIAEAARFVERTFGRLDVLVNNAGICAEARPASSIRPMEIRKVFELNVLAVVAVTQAFVPLLRRSRAGRIVNVSSHRGSLTAPDIAFATQPNMAYSVSKTALNAVTQHFAFELADTPIKVNAGAPKHCATELNGFSPRGRPAAEGARVLIDLATMSQEGPSGGFFDEDGYAPW
jgi:NAD(P)-dependent dehydrogenase (short-subunit alcohol dehydrogenase family)